MLSLGRRGPHDPRMSDAPDELPAGLITSLTNPRVKAAVRLRDRREREATGLTIVDGARELLRALDAGVRRSSPRSSRRTCSGRPTPSRPPIALRHRPGTLEASPAVLAKVAFGDRVGRDRRDRRDAGRSGSRTCGCRTTRSSWSSRASRSRATSAPSCAPRMRPGPTPSSPPTRGPIPFNPNAIRASLGTIFTRAGGRRQAPRRSPPGCPTAGSGRSPRSLARGAGIPTPT